MRAIHYIRVTVSETMAVVEQEICISLRDITLGLILNTVPRQSGRFPAELMVPLVADVRPNQSGVESKTSAPQSPERSPQVNSDLINESRARNYLRVFLISHSTN